MATLVDLPRPAAGNAPEFTVSELSGALKRTVEDSFGRVRVRGEISGYKGPHASGHMYFCLKDATAKLDAVIWKTQRSGLVCRPEEGMEVIATGKLTTYPVKSSYQIVIDRLEAAGVGALLAQLERRKVLLAAEGLFAAERKRALPYLPACIGVITSPTGAVIRDILHRLADRFPRRVLVWPVAVQSEGAAAQVAAAIHGFNAAPLAYRPDLIIVARGGGSIEDLWAFNEEAVVRAVAGSSIPVISAVGHETDTTLCDLAADHRAPTPTAAAERAVPVRAELLAQVASLAARQERSASRHLQRAAERAGAAAARLPSERALLAFATQRLDDLSQRLPSERALLGLARQRLAATAARLPGALASAARTSGLHLARSGRALAPVLLERRAALARRDLSHLAACLAKAARARVAVADRARGRAADPLRPALVRARARTAEARLLTAARLLETLSPIATLGRGYAVVRSAEGGVLATAAAARAAADPSIALRFADGTIAATLGSSHARRARPAPLPATAPPPAQDRLI